MKHKSSSRTSNKPPDEFYLACRSVDGSMLIRLQKQDNNRGYKVVEIYNGTTELSKSMKGHPLGSTPAQVRWHMSNTWPLITIHLTKEELFKKNFDCLL